jgi:histidinol-phosphate aminotransferase
MDARIVGGTRLGFVCNPDNPTSNLADDASLLDTEHQALVMRKNRDGRAILLDTLARLGKRAAPSQTNFVFFETGRPVERLQRFFLERGFLIGPAFPAYTDWARVSIGTPEEMQQFVRALPEALA